MNIISFALSEIVKAIAYVIWWCVFVTVLTFCAMATVLYIKMLIIGA